MPAAYLDENGNAAISGPTALGSTLMVTGMSNTTGIANTGAITSNSMQVTTTASGQAGQKVNGPGNTSAGIGSGETTFGDKLEHLCTHLDRAADLALADDRLRKR